MESTTLTRLRNAVLDALTEGDDRSALELMLLVAGEPQRLSLPPVPEITAPAIAPTAPPRDYHFWAGVLREYFLPFLQQHGRTRFTSHEAMTWIENCDDVVFTTGDLASHSNGREVWRSQVSAALGAMKSRGVIHAETFGRAYTIAVKQLGASA